MRIKERWNAMARIGPRRHRVAPHVKLEDIVLISPVQADQSLGGESVSAVDAPFQPFDVGVCDVPVDEKGTCGLIPPHGPRSQLAKAGFVSLPREPPSTS